MLYLNIILSLGILLLILPFLGLPQSLDNVLYVLSGITIFVLSFVLKRDFDEREDQEVSREDNSGNQV